MNYYIQGNATKTDKIKAAFKKLGTIVPIRRSCADDGLIYFLHDGEVFSITIKAIELFKKNPDYKELKLAVEPCFKVGDEIEATIYGIKRRVTIREVNKINRCYFGTLEECIGFSEQDQWHLAHKPHYDIANFKPFDKVLTRDTEHVNWNVNLFSYYIDDNDARVIARFRCMNSLWSQCIPYNEETKHLLGTTDPCDEQYINW